MGSETTTFLQSQDQSRSYRKKHKETTVVKKGRIINNNNIKDLMDTPKEDDKRGMTYGSGVGLEFDTIHEFIKQTETKKIKN